MFMWDSETWRQDSVTQEVTQVHHTPPTPPWTVISLNCIDKLTVNTLRHSVTSLYCPHTQPVLLLVSITTVWLCNQITIARHWRSRVYFQSSRMIKLLLVSVLICSVFSADQDPLGEDCFYCRCKRNVDYQVSLQIMEQTNTRNIVSAALTGGLTSINVCSTAPRRDAQTRPGESS